MAMAANVDGRLIPGLPDDIALQCIARLPLSTHPVLSHVSRSWRSVVRSPFLFSLRSDLGNKELILVVHVVFPPFRSLWFELHPNHRSFPIPKPHIREGSGMFSVAVDHRLFLIGGCRPKRCSAGVNIYDARSRSWSRGPSMTLRRDFPAAGLIDGRIYVAGGCRSTSQAWAESLDPANPIAGWAPLTVPMRPKKLMLGNVVLDGKLVMTEECERVIAFDPANAALGPLPVPPNLQVGWRASVATVGGIFYTCEVGEGIWGYHPPTDTWKRVEGELPDYKKGAKMRDFGGLMCLVWEDGEEDTPTNICCAAINISETEVGHLRGSVVWFNNNLLKVPKKARVSFLSVLEL